MKPSMLVVAGVLFGSTSSSGQRQRHGVRPADVCEDFSADSKPSRAWSVNDCFDVWAHFEDTIGYKPNHPEARMFRDAASELRQKGWPCMLASTAVPDGLGSTTIRHLSNWILAEEMGCDWVTPDWGYNKVSLLKEKKGVGYCHSVQPSDGRRSLANATELASTSRCSMVDWLSYFQFDKSSVSWPSTGSIRICNKREWGRWATEIADVLQEIELERTESVDKGWKQLVFRVDAITGSSHILDPGSWNDLKRAIARNILGRMRDNFHRQPRQWYDEDPHCLYDQSRLHFALHVRLGDRHIYADQHPDYIERLEEVMSVISQQVADKGLAKPLFHVFSETLRPCPSEETGSFDEFPAWQVAAEQVAACRTAAEHDGTFRVPDKTIVLHLDQDVRRALSCMIQADGILMGCSTFGQIAGLFSRGISMFSTHCGGDRTPRQYRMIPPLAVAERGHLWVPIFSSWFDPVLENTSIFRTALDMYLDDDANFNAQERRMDAVLSSDEETASWKV